MTKARDIADLGAVTSRLDTVGASDGALSNRNIVVNGAMNIDQRNNGSAVTAHNDWSVDRFQLKDVSSGAVSVQQISGTRPDGFKQTLKISCTTADTSFGSTEYFGVRYKVEGHDAAHLNWGTSAAQTVTLSFYVRSNLTGTWGGVINDSSSSAAYAFTYTIDAANTFERKTITIPGPTIGSWATNNATWCELWFAPQAGSNWTASSDNSWNAEYAIVPAATVNNILSSTSNEIYFTGVQLELGDTATPFEHRSYGDELARCQRYYEESDRGGFNYLGVVPAATSNREVPIQFLVRKRANPSITFDISSLSYYHFDTASANSPSAVTASGINLDGFFSIATTSQARTAGDTVACDNMHYKADAEL